MAFKRMVKKMLVARIKNILKKIAIAVGILGVNLLIIRGTFDMYPIGKMTPTLSEDRFLNSLSQNGAKYFIDALKLRMSFKNGNYDLINKLNYKIDELNSSEILNSCLYSTPENKYLDFQPNVIFIMVESFGLPPLDYQSKDFNIYDELEQHFEEDFVWRNFISTGNGTIESLESLLLNIELRPESLPFVESRESRHKFNFAPSQIFNNNGYFSRFIYGGDLSWRNIGDFAHVQGFNNVEGKAHILKTVQNKNRDFFHPWGIHDKYLYEHILKKLDENKNKPQFIFALTTDNHPPYKLPDEWISPSLIFSDELKSNIRGDLNLAKSRFLSFQYAFHSLGKFLTQIKNSEFGKHTIVVVTADNHTADGIMKYKNDEILNSKRIPLYIYLLKTIRDNIKNIDTNIYGSHKDIFATIFDLSLQNTQYFSVGSSLLRKDLPHFGSNASGVIVSKDRALSIKGFGDLIENSKKYEEAKLYRETLLKTEILIRNKQ